MADVFEIECPCCQSVLQVDPETRVVIRHREAVKKPLIEDLAAAVQDLKGAAEKRAEAFSKSFDAHRNSARVLDRKFEELLKQAKEDKSENPPKRPFDLD
jgi:predicted nucleotide-binding protein (sugar kinase/HSP70/actin superfamily)